MKKSEILKKIAHLISFTDKLTEDVNIVKVTGDSREIVENSLFLCEKGENADGHDFIDAAVKKGAALIVGEYCINLENYVQVSSVKSVANIILPEFYGYPDMSMKTVGITGTNGKTSISLLIENILNNRFSCGVTGTLGYRYADRKIIAANTTPVNWKWYGLLDDMKKSGVDVLISEISSHALSENRIVDTLFDAAVFTNLSRDHLDFHKNIEDYYQAKKKLFTDHLKKDACCIINVDDEYGKRLSEELTDNIRVIKISEKNNDAQLKFTILESSSHGSKVLLDGKGVEINVPLVGKYNVYNMLSALAVAGMFAGENVYSSDYSQNVIIPGRLEKISGSNIFVDYAHTPDALENVLKTLVEISESGVVTVFGAGGDRDRGKRPEMGHVVTKYSKISIITDDNPRNEDPQRIVDDILKGCNTQRSVVKVVRDRSTAIKKAIELAGTGDLILVAGKGAEDYQITAEGKRYFSDKKEIEKYIRELHNVYEKNDRKGSGEVS